MPLWYRSREALLTIAGHGLRPRPLAFCDMKACFERKKSKQLAWDDCFHSEIKNIGISWPVINFFGVIPYQRVNRWKWSGYKRRYRASFLAYSLIWLSTTVAELDIWNVGTMKMAAHLSLPFMNHLWWYYFLFSLTQDLDILKLKAHPCRICILGILLMSCKKQLGWWCLCLLRGKSSTTNYKAEDHFSLKLRDGDTDKIFWLGQNMVVVNEAATIYFHLVNASKYGFLLTLTTVIDMHDLLPCTPIYG